MKSLKIMGRNNLWYIPLWLIVLFLLMPIIRADYGDLTILSDRWDWGVFISPAAGIYLLLCSHQFFSPISILLLIPVFFIQDENPMFAKRYLFTLAAVAGILVGSFLIMVLMWGTFPLEVDTQGYIHLRMIPFFPWPTRPF